jgi:hypothetical protein
VAAVPGSEYGLLGLHFTTYKGEPFALPDGVTVSAGDPVGEIHFTNGALVAALGRRAGTDKFLAVAMLRDGLQSLACWMNTPAFPGPVKALYGVSVLSRGAVRLGFTVRDRKPRFRNGLDRLFFDGLLVLYTAEGRDRLLLGRTATDQPREVWISAAELIRRHYPLTA